MILFFFFQAEDGIRDLTVTGVQTCALPIYPAVEIRAENAVPSRVADEEPAARRVGQDLAGEPERRWRREPLGLEPAGPPAKPPRGAEPPAPLRHQVAERVAGDPVPASAPDHPTGVAHQP